MIDHLVAELRTHQKAVAQHIRQAILDETPAYRALEGEEAEAWAAGVRTALGMFVEGGIAGRELTGAERSAMEAIGRSRAEQGMPLDAIAASIAVAARVVRDWPLRRHVGDDDRAALTLFSERVTTFANKLTSAALGAYVARKEELASSLEQARARLFDRVLGGRFRDEQAAMREGEALGCNLALPWVLVLLPAAGSARTTDRLEVDALGVVPGAVVVPVETAATPHSVLALPVAHEEQQRFVRASVEEVVRVHNLSVLWAGPCRGVDALHRSYQAARSLVSFADRMAAKPAVVDMAQHREAALLATVPEDLRHAYVAEVLGSIERQPRQRARRLLHTLEALVQSDSLKAAAIRLGVNAKTVRRRLEDVERLSGLRLDRPDDVHRVRTALTMRRLSGGGALGT